MPYLQIDVPNAYSTAVKTALVKELAELYARVMETQSRIVTVGFRELGAANVMRYDGHAAHPTVAIMCDIRRGRPPEQRRRLAEAMVETVAAALSWPKERIVLEFTQHDGDEMYRDGGYVRDWNAAEALI
ncbi:MAG: hypothetical protein ABR591_11620 [Candidatus Velthaea sp.]